MGFSGDDIDIGVNVHANPDAAQTITAFRQQLAALRADLAQAAQKSATIGDAAADSTAINRAIGAFQKLGQQVDINSQKTVAGFRAQGDAVAAFLAKLGATDAELNKIGATISSVEQRAGAAAAVVGRVVPDELPARVNASTFAIRRGADAMSSMAFAATAGRASLQNMSIGAGSMTSAVVSLAGGTLLASTVVGGLVTIGLTLIGVLDDAKKSAKEADKELENFAGLSADIIAQRANDTRQEIATLTRLQAQLRELSKTAPLDPQSAQLTEQGRKTREAIQGLANDLKLVNTDKSGHVLDAKKIIDANDISNAIDKIEEKLIELTGLQLKQSKAAQEAQAKADTEILDQQIHNIQAAEVARIASTQGESAARRRQIQFDLDNELQAIKTSGARADLQASATRAAREKNVADLTKFDAEQAQKAAESRAAAETKQIKAIEDTRIASAKDTEAETDAVTQHARDARDISEREAIARRRDATLAEINAEESARLRSIGTQIFAQNKLLTATVDPEKRSAIAKGIEDLETQQTKVVTDANQKRTKVQTDAARETATVTRQLRQEVEQVSVQSLEEQGRFLEAAKIQVQRESRDAILEASAAGDAAALSAIRQRIAAIIHQAQAREIETTATEAITAAQSALQRINLQVQARAITPSAGRSQIVDELTKERDAVASLLPSLERVAVDLPGNAEAQAKLERYRTELVRLNLDIGAAADQFHDLKLASIDAFQQGLARFFESLSSIGPTDEQKSKIGALKDELRSTTDELNALLSAPASQRTPENDRRITDLRSQVSALNQELNDSKHAVTTLAQVFGQAALSIVQSIQRIVSQMLAQLAVQRLLQAFGGFQGAGDGGQSAFVNAIAGQAIPGIQIIGHAGGGVIRGPGTGTSDSILARVSNGEGIVTARAMSREGVAKLDALNAGQATILTRDAVRVIRGFRDGGVVSLDPTPSGSGLLAPGEIGRSASGGPTTFEHHFVLDVPPGFILRHLDSPAAEQQVVRIVTRHANAVNAGLGRR